MIEVGEYVRTEYGKIFKALGDQAYLDCHGEEVDFVSDIKTHSKNIIDIVELYDYVNGFIVFDIITRDNGEKAIQLMHGVLLEQDEIDSIVTHEQFEAMKYKVEE